MFPIVIKRSSDGGRSWSSNQMLVEPATTWGAAETNASLFNPTPVWDEETGEVHVVFAYFPVRYMTKPPIEWAIPQVHATPQYKRVLEYLSRYGIRSCSGGYLVPARALANPIAR